MNDSALKRIILEPNRITNRWVLQNGITEVTKTLMLRMAFPILEIALMSTGNWLNSSKY
jgi:hypothetical protein